MISRENKQRAEELRKLLELEGFCKIQFYIQEQSGFEINVFMQAADRKIISEELSVFVEAWKNDRRYYTYANNLEIPEEIACRMKETDSLEKHAGQEEKQVVPWSGNICGEQQDSVKEQKSPYTEEMRCAEGVLKRAEHAALAHGADVVNECSCYQQRTATAIYYPDHQWMEDEGEYRYMGISCIAREDGDTAVAYCGAYGMWGKDFSPEALAKEAAVDAKDRLHSRVLSSGNYPVLLKNTVMAELLEAYLPIFYGSAMQEGMSRLSGREKTKIAAAWLDIVEDPKLDGGRETRTIDDEGTAVQKKYIVREGNFETALYHHTSARESGEKQSTGNGFKVDFRSEISTGVTNVEMRRSDGKGKTLEELMMTAGEGILVTGIDGTFAGINTRTGSFSLISKGIVIRNGKKAEAFSQVTIAGNFYDMLEQMREMGNDYAETSPSAAFVRAPSVYVGNLTVSGK